MAVSFGLHVGHTSACLAVHREGRCDVVANDAGDRVTAAIVGWNDKEVLVGAAAKQLASRTPGAIVQANKALIEMDANSPKLDYFVQLAAERQNAKIVTADGRIGYSVAMAQEQSPLSASPASVAQHIYRYMHDIALAHATAEVDQKNTVITVPLEFTQKQREAVARCAQKAGFHVVQVITEPAAACLAYGLGQLDPTERSLCLVYHVGGHSLCVTVVQVQCGMLKVLQSLSRHDVGGHVVSQLLCDYLAQEFARRYKVDPRETKRGRLKLQTSADNVKHILSTLETANCYIESLYEGIDFQTNVTRARFENELTKVLADFMDPIEQLLKQSNLSAAQLDKVIFSGGCTKIPRLQQAVSGRFSHCQCYASISPDEVVAMGAATQASLLHEPLSVCSGVTISATSADLVFTSNWHSKPSILLPAGFPVPGRLSAPITIPADGVDATTELTVQVSLAQESHDDLLHLAKLSITGLTSDSKVSLSGHLHRDGSLHLALTDKMRAAHGDQVTLSAS